MGKSSGQTNVVSRIAHRGFHCLFSSLGACLNVFYRDVGSHAQTANQTVVCSRIARDWTDNHHVQLCAVSSRRTRANLGVLVYDDSHTNNSIRLFSTLPFEKK